MNKAFLFDPASGTDWQDWMAARRDWLVDHGPRIVAIAVILLLADVLFRRVVSRVLLNAITRAVRSRREDQEAIRRRADTLSSTLNWAFAIFLVFLGTGVILAEVGLNVSALIAGVGVVGIALGLGAQTLVRDVINGLFILIEDQYRVGDLVTVGGATGEVIEINPRRTVLRDGDGNIHSIPNSAVAVAVNRTPAQNRIRVEIEVPFRESDEATALTAEVCNEIGEAHAGALVSLPKVVDQAAIRDGDVRILVAGDARQGERWQVEADLRRRLKRRFDAEGIEMSFVGGGPERAG
jgi:small conductance mechanosensitive channel